MNNKTLKGALLAGMSIIVFSCNEKKEETTAAVIDKEQIKKEIQAKENAFAAVYNSGELREIGYYADDATTYFPNRSPLVGKQAILDFMKSDMDSNSGKRITFETKDVFVSSDGNQVVEIGHFQVVDSPTNVAVNSGHYMSLFEKRAGQYVCVRDMSASEGEAQ